MKNRFLVTRIPTVDEEEADKLEATLGRKPVEGKDIEYTYAETVIDLMEVSAVHESYSSDKLMEDEAVIYLYGEPYFIQSPYIKVRDQWLALLKGEPDRTIDVADAVDILTTALDESRDDPNGLYYGYQSNIALAFTQAFKRERYAVISLDEEPNYLHDIANQAAKNFLDLLIKSVD